jgi:ABC-type polysaccharide/polyol phosphate export permease
MLAKLQIRNNYESIAKDVRFCIDRRQSWFSLGRQDIISSYRRTVLGPLWITIHQVAFVAGVGIVYSQLFRVPSQQLVPTVLCGFVIWTFMVNLINASSGVFVESSSFIKSTDIPPLFYAIKSVSTQTLIFMQSSIILITVPLFSNRAPTLETLIVVPLTVILLIVNGVALCMWLGFVSARYRDVKLATSTVIQVAFFLTPVFWSSRQLQGREWILFLNPFAWVIESVRPPIMGEPLEYIYVLCFAAFTTINMGVGAVASSRFKGRLSLWV